LYLELELAELELQRNANGISWTCWCASMKNTNWRGTRIAEDCELNVELEVVRGGQHEELELELEGTVKWIRAGTCAPG